MNDKLQATLDDLSSDDLAAYLKARKRREYLALGAVDGWERVAEGFDLNDEGDDDFVKFNYLHIDAGDWVWRDESGRVRRTFGWSGGSHMRAHTFDGTGHMLYGVELRDAVADGDLDVPEFTAEYLPAIRQYVTNLPIDVEIKRP